MNDYAELITAIRQEGVSCQQDDYLDELGGIIEQLAKEREAAVNDLKLSVDDGVCHVCNNFGKDYPLKGKCKECFKGAENNFEWRGMQDGTD